MVTVYGADWCEDPQRSLRHLRRLGVENTYVNIDRDPAALEHVKLLNAGTRRTPTIDIDGTTLVEPTNHELTVVLEQHGILDEAEAELRLRARNVGDLERGLRVVGGAVAVASALRIKGPWKWPVVAWGAFEMVSGAAGYCPVYSAAGRSSLGGPGDHPREAERSAWLAPAV